MTLDLPQLPAVEAGYLTRLSRHGGAGCVRFIGADWRFRLRPATSFALKPDVPDDLVDPVFLTIDLGGARIVLAVDGGFHGQVLRTIDPGGDPMELPEPLRLALSELAVEELSTALEEKFGRDVRIVASDHTAPRELGRHRVDFQLSPEDGGSTVHGCLFADGRGLSLIAELADRLPETAAELDDWQALPVPLRFVIGWTDLRVADLKALGRRDVVVLDEATLVAEDRLILHAPGLPCLVARLEGTTLSIEKTSRTIMNEPTDSAPAATEAATAEGPEDTGAQPDGAETPEPLLDSLDDVIVRLTFDIGERELTLGELRALAPGASFDLGSAPRQAVNLRANGKLIGTGELVRIDEHIGVRIGTLAGAAE